jgi:DNA-directed RNA polymerase subunit RPC12/RpoP
MKMIKYLVFSGAVLISVSAGGVGMDVTGKKEPGSGPAEVYEQRDTLDGLEGVLVSGGFRLPDEISGAGVLKKRILTEIEKLLGQHGIRTYSFEEYKKSNRMPVVVFEISSIECPGRAGRYAVWARLALWQRVTLLTEPSKSYSAMTWQAWNYGTASKDFLYEDLMGMWEELALKFIKDFPGVRRAVVVEERASGIEQLKRGVLYWVKCTNPKCEHEWQMDRKDYFMYLRDHQNPMVLAAPAVACPKCSEASGYRSEKCEKCGTMFLRGSVPHDFADRCPECGHSRTEVLRREARNRDKRMEPKAEKKIRSEKNK